MLVGLIVIVAGGGLVVWAFIEAVQAEPAVVGSLGVALVGVLGVVWQQRQAERDRLREANRDRMTPIYYELLGTIFQKIGSSEEQGDPDPETCSAVRCRAAVILFPKAAAGEIAEERTSARWPSRVSTGRRPR